MKQGMSNFYSCCFMLLALLSFGVNPSRTFCSTPQQGDDADGKINSALQAYKEANFDQSILILSKLSQDAGLSRTDRLNVLHHLALCYTAKKMFDKALDVLGTLLENEPPIVEIDPDQEPHKFIKLYYQARKKKDGSDKLNLIDPGIKTIAVLDFSNRSMTDFSKYDPMGKGLADFVINMLHGIIKLKVVEREHMQYILDEIGMENDPLLFDSATAVRIGRQLGVHTMLFGSFMILNEKKMKVMVRLVKVETSEILMGETLDGKFEDLFPLVEKITEKVAQRINVEINTKVSDLNPPPQSLEAIMAYSEGLLLSEKEDYKNAYDKFQQALTYDPKYERARKKMESIRPYLKIK